LEKAWITDTLRPLTLNVNAYRRIFFDLFFETKVESVSLPTDRWISGLDRFFGDLILGDARGIAVDSSTESGGTYILASFVANSIGPNTGPYVKIAR
jgi:hypothetical protein